jgi:uncharacterized protein (DUF488 family)
MMVEKIFTIGAYGKSEHQFFEDLAKADIDTFCDIRQRRGVRGSQYAFVNRKRLENSLASRSIDYRYFSDLAPTQQIRELQHKTDAEEGRLKRERQQLGSVFSEHYTSEILGRFDSNRFKQQLGSAKRIVLFCVEGPAVACHRSLVADRLHLDWNVPVEHL